MGLIHEIELLVNTGQTAAASAKFYVEVSANSDFTNSVKYGFGSGYSDEKNITLLSEGSTISNVLTKSGSIIKIDVSGDNEVM